MKNASTSFSPVIARQMELTISALARSARKAIRTADKEAPSGKGGPWEVVEHRLQLLETMLKAIADFSKAPELESEVVEDEVESTPAKAEAEPLPKQKKTHKPIHNTPPKPINIRPQTSGKGWRLAA